MKKLASSLFVVSVLALAGCSSTMEVTYSPIEEVETSTDWEIDMETGSWEPVESQSYIIKIEEKEHRLPQQFDRLSTN